MAASTSTYRSSTRGQWVAVVATIIVTAGLAIGLPRVADAVKPQDTALTAGERVEAGGVSIVPAAGWVKAAGSPLLTINKESAGLNVLAPAADTRTAAEAVTAAAAGFTTATVSEVTTFTTDSGLAGALATADDGTSMTVLIALSDGAQISTGIMSIDPAAWPEFKDEVESMLKTIEFTGAVPS